MGDVADAGALWRKVQPRFLSSFCGQPQANLYRGHAAELSRKWKFARIQQRLLLGASWCQALTRWLLQVYESYERVSCGPALAKSYSWRSPA